MRPTSNIQILFVDDDAFASRIYVEELLYEGYQVTSVRSAKEALGRVRARRFDLVILDVMMPHGSSFSAFETEGGFKTGIALAREIRDSSPLTKIIALTHSNDPEVVAWFSQDKTYAYLYKMDVNQGTLARIAKNILGEKLPPRIFIVHGRNKRALRALKKLVSDDLKLGEPIILADEPSDSKTVIEKFEYYAGIIDVVFVLATPDDIGYLASTPHSTTPRPRANVVFEFGYFLAALKRASGRVILLQKGPIELPSDVAGLCYIDISKGMKRALSEIKRELAQWL